MGSNCYGRLTHSVTVKGSAVRCAGELQARGWAPKHLHRKHVTAFEIQTADGLMAVNLWHDHTLNDIITCRDGFPRFTDVKSVFFSLPKTSLFLFSPLLVTWQVDMTAAPVLFQQTSFWPEWWQLMVNFLILPRFTLNNTTAATPEHSGACRRKDTRIKFKITYSEITKTWMLLCLKK